MPVGSWIKRIAIGGVLGVSATVGTAWLSAALTSPSKTGVQVSDIVVRSAIPGEFVRITDERRALGLHTLRAWTVQPADETSQRTIDARLTDRRPSWLDDDDLRLSNMIEDHAGWPARALRAGWRGGPRGDWPCVLISDDGDNRSLPIVPMWGFLVNTAVFGAVYVAAALVWPVIAAFVRGRASEPALERIANVWIWGHRATVCLAAGVLVTGGTAWWLSIRAEINGAGPGGSAGLGGGKLPGIITVTGTGTPLLFSSARASGAGATGPSTTTTQTRYADATLGNEYIVDETRGRGWRMRTVTCSGPRTRSMQVMRTQLATGPRGPGAAPPPSGPDLMGLPSAPRWMVDTIQDGDSWTETAYGWPLKTLVIGGQGSYWLSELRPPMSLVVDGETYPLPIKPSWVEFVVSVGVVGGALGAAMVLTGLWRRRVGPGRCRKCLYDLRGLPDASACPECGSVRKQPASAVAMT